MSKQHMKAFIFARGGSKGVPGKNIKQLGGKPLIAHAIECALACPSLGSVSVSTDDAEIAEVARRHGADVPFIRPTELAGDTSSEWLAWRHAIEHFRKNGDSFDVLVSLPATSPFRAVNDVEACIACLREDPAADAVVTVKKAERSPWFNMVKLEPDGRARLVNEPGTGIHRRQDAPAVFDMTTVAYAVKTAFIMEHEGLFSGRVRAVEVPQERALDIDTPYDFMLGELLASRAQ